MSLLAARRLKLRHTTRFALRQLRICAVCGSASKRRRLDQVFFTHELSVQGLFRLYRPFPHQHRLTADKNSLQR